MSSVRPEVATVALRGAALLSSQAHGRGLQETSSTTSDEGKPER
jgi:hypothetical protein